MTAHAPHGPTPQGQHHDHETDIYDLGLQADLAMWQRTPIEGDRF